MRQTRWAIWTLGAWLGSSLANGLFLADTDETTVLFSEPRLSVAARAVALDTSLRIEGVPVFTGTMDADPESLVSLAASDAGLPGLVTGVGLMFEICPQGGHPCGPVEGDLRSVRGACANARRFTC